MNQVLITGGTGFVGANLARRLLAEGCEVHLIVRPGFHDWRIRSIEKDLHLNAAAVEDADGLAKAVTAVGPEAVFHLAAHGAYPHQTDRRRMFDTNVLGTRNVVTAALDAGAGSIVVAGSSSEYGRLSRPHSETDAPHPESDYARTKAAAAAWCEWKARENGAAVTTLRLYSVYGPWEEPTRLIPRLIVEGRRGKWPPLADPSTARDFVYVDDAVEAFLLAAKHKPQNFGAVYNVGTGLQTTLAEAAQAARELFNQPAEPSWGGMPDRIWDTACWVADNRLIQTDLGWRPQTEFRDGLRKTLAWYQSSLAVRDVYEGAPADGHAG
jgi:nucleoside-diphosphate-sugar epimerase